MGVDELSSSRVFTLTITLFLKKYYTFATSNDIATVEASKKKLCSS